MANARDVLSNWKSVPVLALIVLVCGGLSGCPRSGACCDGDGACTVVTEAECLAIGGTYQGDDTLCDESTCEREITIFSYRGGDCPDELTVKDGDPGNVECGVPRTRLFDDNSPLDGSMADDPDGDFGTFPGPDDPDGTGILVRLDGFAVDPGDDRANIVVICLNIVIPPQAGGMRSVKCMITRAAGFELTPEAQAVVDSGKRNYWAHQARRLAKLEADAAGGVDPRAGTRAQRLRRSFQRKNNRDYEVLADGTRYMPELMEETEKIEIDPPTPGAILTMYLVFVGDAFSSFGQFIPSMDVILSSTPGTDSPMLGDINDNALVLESVDELGPAIVADFSGGVFSPNLIDFTNDANRNPEDAIWIINSSANDLTLEVPGHPLLILPPDREVAFNDLAEGGTISGHDGLGNTATLDVLTSDRTIACCFDAECSDAFLGVDACFDAGGTPVVDASCFDNPCAPTGGLACCIEGQCDDLFASEDDCFNAGGTPFPGRTCDDNPCPSGLGQWADTLGNYLLQGNCPGNGQQVSLNVVDDILVMQGLPENDDIPLICEDDLATGDNVTAFGVEGHEITLLMQDTGLILSLFQPETLGACSAQMTPQ